MYGTRGIVLSHKERGEADMLITIFSERYGLLKAVAQGVRKPNAKLSGHVEPGTVAEVSFVEGKSGYRLTGSSMIESFSFLRGDERRLKAFFAVAVVLETISFEGEERSVWETFLQFSRWLNQPRDIFDRDISIGTVRLFSRLLLEFGYQMSQDAGLTIGKRSMSLLERLEAGTLEESVRQTISEAELSELTAAVRNSFENHFGYRFLFLSAAKGG